MKYVFDAEVAEICGVDGAVMLHNLQFWIEKNEANNKHFYDGRYWTYNSMKAFAQLFPFWSERQINRILTNLENDGYIITGNYNKVAYDRTKWYAITEMGYSILQNGDFHFTKQSNGNDQTVEPIPDINTDINTNNKPGIISKEDVQTVITKWNSIDGIKEIKLLKTGSKRYQSLKARVEEYGLDAVIEAIENISLSNFLLGKNSKNWQITFDWFVLPNNFIKVYEGNYTDKSRVRSNNSQPTRKAKLEDF